MFGYNDHTGALYGGSWLDNAMAIQAMVWVITGGQYGTAWETRIADNLLQGNPTARSIYNQIRTNMESYDTIPSFTASSAGSAKDYELKYNMNNGKFDMKPYRQKATTSIQSLSQSQEILTGKQ